MNKEVIRNLIKLVDDALEHEYYKGTCELHKMYIKDLINAQKELLIELNGDIEFNDEIIKKMIEKYVD